MITSSPSIVDRSRNIVSTVLQRLAGGNQAAIAAAIGASESMVSRFKSEPLEQAASILAAAGLKVVPVEYQCVDPRKAEAMGILLNAAIEKAGNPAALLWDET